MDGSTAPNSFTSQTTASEPTTTKAGISSRLKKWFSKKILRNEYGGNASDAGDLFLGLMAPIVAGTSVVAGASLIWPITLGLGVLALVAGKVIENNAANQEFQEFTTELIEYINNVQSMFFPGLNQQELQYMNRQADIQRRGLQKQDTPRTWEETIEDKAKECIYRMSMMYHADHTIKEAFGLFRRFKRRIFPHRLLAKLRNELLFLTSYLTLLIQQKLLTLQGNLSSLQSLVIVQVDSPEGERLVNEEVNNLKKDVEIILTNTSLTPQAEELELLESSSKTTQESLEGVKKNDEKQSRPSFTKRLKSYLFGTSSTSGGRKHVLKTRKGSSNKRRKLKNSKFRASYNFSRKNKKK